MKRGIEIALVGLLLAGAVGCSPDYSSCSVSCVGTGICPRGFSCGLDGFCYDSAEEAAARACTAIVGDGGGPIIDGMDGGDTACDMFEPDDSNDLASTLNVPGLVSGHAVCSPNDADVIRLNFNAVPTAPRVIVSFTGPVTVVVSLLTGSGSFLASSSTVVDNTLTLDGPVVTEGFLRIGGDVSAGAVAYTVNIGSAP